MTPVVVLSLLSCGPWLAAQPPARQDAALTDAERIAKVQLAIDRDQKQLQQLKDQVNDPSGEYAQAEAQFHALEKQWADAKKEVDALTKAGKLEEAAKAGKHSKVLEKERQRALDRFNLAIDQRKIVQAQAAAVQQRVQQAQQWLARLLDPSADARAAGGASPAKGDKAAPAAKAGAAPAAAAPAPQRPLSKHLAEALEEARALEKAADEARAKVQFLAERLDSLRQSVALEQKLLETARKRADQAQEEYGTLGRVLAKRKAEKAAEADLRPLAQKAADAEQRMNRAREEASASTGRLGELREQLTALQAKQAALQKAAEEKQADAERARRRVAQLEDPFSIPNLVDWACHHGPRAALILVGMLVLSRLVRLAGRRIVRFMAQHGHRGSPEENESRAQTLVGVFRNAASLALLGGGTLMLLDEVGVPIMPLLGGAAVVGLAVAFGAQNLIRDYFSGFMVLMEDQYGINDVVKIGDVSGTVEKITLRVTVLRDMGGVVHFIPHGTITTVSNLTHGWSQALFDIPVSSAEDVDRAMAVLIELGKELRHDPAFAPLTLAGPEMLGVDDLADGKVQLRFFIKTRPLKQWLVKREMLRRIKLRFDELGIGSPFSPRPVKGKEARPLAA
jgi:small conductance mechanosensitive channel